MRMGETEKTCDIVEGGRAEEDNDGKNIRGKLECGLKVENEDASSEAAKCNALGPEGTKAKSSLGRSVGVHSFGDHIARELIGTDRPGLLSEIFAVLANQHCNVAAAEVWTHKTRVASFIYINADVSSRMPAMEEQLRNVLQGGDDLKGSRTSFSMGSTHVDRRLHQS
ncbi:hypothetical protein ZIOFF_058875 [Zingiber officinale]|uniref:ACT domain-containing protein ACR n=1 Tax=Zingiber officinale TaxID=94328 RepID=A0A8J5FH59_ZINOF|nr:hypothetical protein ZIOFF_058875 [Zingiber officinale]